MKTVILILSTRSNSYKKFKEAIRETWMKDSLDNNIPCYFYEGGWNQNEVVGDTIRLVSDDSLAGTYQKFIDCLNFIDQIPLHFDVMFRTNLSSYIDIPVFKKFVEKNHFSITSYEGVKGKTTILRERIYMINTIRRLSRFAIFGESIPFISGAGLFLGSEATRALQLYRGSKNNINIIDDVKIGWILNDSFQSLIDVNRFDILDTGAHKIGEGNYNNKVHNGLFHYKFKNKNRSFDYENLKNFHDIEYRHSICVKP